MVLKLQCWTHFDNQCISYNVQAVLLKWLNTYQNPQSCGMTWQAYKSDLILRCRRWILRTASMLGQPHGFSICLETADKGKCRNSLISLVLSLFWLEYYCVLCFMQNKGRSPLKTKCLHVEDQQLYMFKTDGKRKFGNTLHSQFPFIS